jgi:pyruvate dehydrogenase E2 component (dihydrolipoamide acetyltransferase)
MMGIRRFDAILNVPQAAILAVGSTEQRFRKVNGQENWIPVAEFTLTCDHRAIDGATGAKFLQHFAQLLQGPISAA